MAQVDFFSGEADADDLVRLFLHQGFHFVPLLTYPTPDVMRIQDLEAFKRVASNTRDIIGPFLLMLDEVSVWPLNITETHGTTGRFYSPVQRHGGPYLRFRLSQPRENEGDHGLGGGSIGYYATYKNTLTGEYEKLPALLRSKYRQIVRHIKKRGLLLEQECIGGGTREFWILPGAEKALKKGAKLGDFEGAAAERLKEISSAD